MKYAVYNPKNLPEKDLPIIFGFNNGSGMGGVIGMLIAQDGTVLGSHASSHEAYLYGDLGIQEGSRPDRHETFQKHYPDGYRMDFVSYEDAPNNAGLQAAFELHKENPKPAPEGSTASVKVTLA